MTCTDQTVSAALVLDQRCIGDRKTPLGLELTQSGDAVNLTGCTVAYTLTGPMPLTTSAGSGSVTVINAAAGLVAITWAAGDVDAAGDYQVRVTVTNGSGLKDTFPSSQGATLVLRVVDPSEW